MARILGIDPGSRITGFGVIETDGNKSRYIASGALKIQGETLPEKLNSIFEQVSEVVTEWQPNEVAIEKVFLSHNPGTALKLGHARGAAICATTTKQLTVYEYTPAEIKKALVGRGNAEKDQVQHMVKLLLNHQEKLTEDASDALGCAVCHAHQALGIGVTVTRGRNSSNTRSSSWRNYKG